MIGKIGFGALLFALVLAPIIGGYPGGSMFGADVSLNALHALVILSAICLLINPSASGQRNGFPFLWIAFALTFVSLLVHSRFLSSPVWLFAQLPATLDWLCYALIFALCAKSVRDDRKTLWWIIGAVAVGVAWAAISGAREYGQNVQSHDPQQRVSGPFFDPNFLAGFLALGLPLVVAACLAVRERLGALGFGVLAALTVGALAATGSRAGLGIAVAGLIVTLALTGISLRAQANWGRVAAVLVACLALAVVFRGPFTARVGASAGDAQEHSAAFRSWTWRGTLAMAKANPILGTGPGTYPYSYAPYALVEKTGLAHESYLQMAAEQGFPALLAAVLALLATLLAAASALLRRTPPNQDVADAQVRILLCGVVGALIAGALRSVFDSEWSILGNGLPFWATVGLASGIAASLTAASPTASAKRDAAGAVAAVLLVAPLALALVLLHNAQVHDAASDAVKKRQTPEISSVWPPDPDLLYWAGQPDEAARVDPSSRSFYRWARMLERAGDEAGAITQFQRAARSDPNNLQSWHALADAQEKSGDDAGALASWNELIRHHEGPSGQIRAIPELAETHPAFAYAAVAQAAATAGHADEAKADYENAAKVVEDYSRTPPIYQQTELLSAQTSGVDVTARRQQVRDLYQRVISALAAFPDTSSEQKADLTRREQDTLSRIGRFADSLSAAPDTTGGGAPAASSPSP